ncbi:carboxylate-amine ligase [bacterium]|nr:carboxylate-amine ligase [bacterium]
MGFKTVNHENWRTEFKNLQKHLPAAWQSVQRDPDCERTVVVVPSISLPPSELAGVAGSVHYEERLLSFLTLLSMPRTHVVYLSALQIPDEIVSYYLQFLPGVTFSHARERLHLISLMDRSDRPLTLKILERPSVIERIKAKIVNPALSYIEAYYNTELERELAAHLGIPLFGPSDDLNILATKSGTRGIFAKLGIAHPKGCGSLYSLEDIAQALIKLRSECPNLRKVVLKLNEGFSGIGSIVLDLALFAGFKEAADIAGALEELPRQVCGDVSWPLFCRIMKEQGGVLEAFIDTQVKTSPTMQVFINPMGEITIDSTHEQILGGSSALEFIGCSLPAKACYVGALHRMGMVIAEELAKHGAVGPVSIDFLAVPKNAPGIGGLIEGDCGYEGDWAVCAIEINLRRGGTTHPLHTTMFLTGGRYEPKTGTFSSQSGHKICYVSFSNIAPPESKGLCPNDIIDIITDAGLHYNSTLCSGVIFHMMGALSQYGRLGATCIARTQEDAWELVEETKRVLSKEAKELNWLL